MHRGNNWGYHEGEREGVNAQGKTTGVRFDMGKGKQPSFGKRFQQPQLLMSCIPGALFVLWDGTVLDILWMTVFGFVFVVHSIQSSLCSVEP